MSRLANSGINPTIERIFMRRGCRPDRAADRSRTRRSHPTAEPILADAIDGAGDGQEVLEELRGDVFVSMIVLRQFERDAHQVQAIHRHPAGAVGLVDIAAGRQRTAAIEYADVVQAEKAALENVAPLRVLAIHPPGEIHHQLVEHALQECQVARSSGRFRAAGGRSETPARPPRRAPAD